MQKLRQHSSAKQSPTPKEPAQCEQHGKLPKLPAPIPCLSPEEKAKAGYSRFMKRLRMMRNSKSFPEAAAWIHELRRSDQETFNAIWNEAVHKSGKAAARTARASGEENNEARPPQLTLEEFGLAGMPRHGKQGEEPPSHADCDAGRGWMSKARELRNATDSAAPGSGLSSLMAYLSVIAGQDDAFGRIARTAIDDLHSAESARPGMVCDSIISASLTGKEAKGAILNEPELRRRIFETVRNGGILRLNVIWGGFKEAGTGAVTEADRQAFETLHKFRDRIRQAYPNTSISIIFCDVHAARFSGTASERIERYFGKRSGGMAEQGILSLAASHGMPAIMLSNIYEAQSRSVKPFGEGDMEEARRIAESNPGYFESVQESAKKHSTARMHGSEKLRQLALEYIARRRYESKLFEAESPGSVFLSFGIPERERLLSNIPTVFIYPHGKKSDLPWFMDSYSKQ